MAGLCEEDFRNIADDIDLADFKIVRLLNKLKCLLPKGKTNIRKRLYSMSVARTSFADNFIFFILQECAGIYRN